MALSTIGEQQSPGGNDLLRSVVFVGDNGNYIDWGGASVFKKDRTDVFSISVWHKFGRIALGVSILFGNLGPALPAPTFRGWELYSINSTYGFFFISDLSTGNNIQMQTPFAPTTTTVGFDQGRWHNFIVSHTGTGTAAGITFYVDGVDVTPVATVDALVGSTLATGGTASGIRLPSKTQNLTGGVSNFSIWDRALSSPEAVELYNSGVPTDLSAHSAAVDLEWWAKLGEGDEFPIVRDQVANAHGTIVLDTHYFQANFTRDHPSA